ncbi:MAG: thermonuclease family protein [Peptostreptococcus sp.]|uniref:thermonuclease family protein n=1 Tax=Bacillota TaxID=1239 RepID=UPI0029081AFC|nr:MULTISPECIES: thermonuclease family protein [Bacillota]MDU3434315.1 thermonuclease family protein [Veillonella sp.]MDU3454565.1 thermonuclease family protein [Peptostreptococcus sp.]MDU5681736.1 thermonuclease family protein [Peptostreptococcus sp.]MDU5738731.1 thermonuclease family protein [Peptostreptococcus sp.]
MFVFLSFVFFISFISLIVFGILTIKNRKNDKKKKYSKNCKILIGVIILSFIGCGVFASESTTKNSSKPVEVKTKKDESKKINTRKDEPKKVEHKKEIKKVEPTTNNTFDEAKVIRVVDGDTIHVLFNGQKYKIRMIGVDTPETVHPNKPVEFYGKEASDFTKKSLNNKTVYLQKDVSETDRYGRLLRYVWLSRPSSNEPDENEIVDKMYNAILVKQGYAQAYTYQPDSKYSHIFTRLQHNARENNLGLWSSGNIEPKQDEQLTSNASGKSEYTADTTENGKIKGNIKSKKYHIPGSRSYNKISEENVIYFNTEQEAIDAGYVRAKR